MVTITLPDELAEKLDELSRREHRSPEAVIKSMFDQYTPAEAEASVENETEAANPFTGLIGLLDDVTDATDLSSTIRETLATYTHPQYGWTKRDRTD